MSEPPTPDPQPAKPAPPVYALVTAGVLLLLYVGLTLAMMFEFSDQPRWDHALLIYNGFTAFAVAAGGVLLGAQIQQANVNTARRDAQAAKVESERAKQAVRSALASMEPSMGPQADLRMAEARSHLAAAL